MQQFKLQDINDITNYMTVVDTYTATIYVGTSETGLWSKEPIRKAKSICQKYCDTVGLCVTVKQVTFIYSNGTEEGVEVGLINYPRFPSNKQTLQMHAVTLAKLLKKELEQKRVSVVFPDNTYMIGHPSDNY